MCVCMRGGGVKESLTAELVPLDMLHVKQLQGQPCVCCGTLQAPLERGMGTSETTANINEWPDKMLGGARGTNIVGHTSTANK